MASSLYEVKLNAVTPMAFRRSCGSGVPDSAFAFCIYDSSVVGL